LFKRLAYEAADLGKGEVDSSILSGSTIKSQLLSRPGQPRFNSWGSLAMFAAIRRGLVAVISLAVLDGPKRREAPLRPSWHQKIKNPACAFSRVIASRAAGYCHNFVATEAKISVR
jgi:hypothetical protein